MFDLTGKTAIVTGSTQGIGFETAKLLAEQGAKVFVCGATSILKCEKACEKIKNSSPILCNLKNMDSIDEMYNKTGDVDILVLNASIQKKKNWDEFTESDFDDHINCNLKSSYFLIKKYVPGMKKKKFGRIVTLGSVNQYNNHPMLSLYGATKSAQYKLVKNIAPLIAPFGITINNVCPGAINTPRNEKDLENEEFKKSVINKIPCGYIGEPSDIAPQILLLCSDEGRYITGSEIVIDGGMSL